jgi:hypothetical protein
MSSGRKRLCDQMHGSARVEAKGATLCELSEAGKTALDACLEVEQERGQNSMAFMLGNCVHVATTWCSISCAYSLHARESK